MNYQELNVVILCVLVAVLSLILIVKIAYDNAWRIKALVTMVANVVISVITMPVLLPLHLMRKYSGARISTLYKTRCFGAVKQAQDMLDTGKLAKLYPTRYGNQTHLPVERLDGVWVVDQYCAAMDEQATTHYDWAAERQMTDDTLAFDEWFKKYIATPLPKHSR